MSHPLTVEALRRLAHDLLDKVLHDLVDKVLDELANWQEKIEEPEIPGKSIVQRCREDIAEGAEEQKRTPRRSSAAVPSPKAIAHGWVRMGNPKRVPAATAQRKSGPRALDVVSMAVRQTGESYTLELAIPVAASTRAGLKTGKRAQFAVVGRTIVVKPVDELDEGITVSDRGGQTVAIRPSGRPLGLCKPQHATHCTWHLNQEHHLVADLPDWWPHSEVSAVRTHPKPEDEVGEALENSEFPCHVDDCQGSATRQCNLCDGLFCGAHWPAHVRGHQQRHAEHQQAIHA
ncbi:MAG: hypothetical protein ABR961_03270 [Thermoanaerobaculaceae bacterium]|jgi:hypothetical protein